MLIIKTVILFFIWVLHYGVWLEVGCFPVSDILLPLFSYSFSKSGVNNMINAFNKYLNIEEYKKDNFLIVRVLINAVCLMFILLGVYMALTMLLSNRSLWVDEAMLAYSFSTRSITDLTSDKFEWIQSAPVIYLYIVKIITLVFGNTELTLRVWTFTCFLITLYCLYYILRRILNIRFPLFALVFVTGCIPYFLSFSVEFKPYMSDAATVLLSIIIYYLYTEKKLGIAALSILFSILVWNSNAVCFFIGACMLYEFVEGVYKKDTQKIKYIVICGICVGVSFIAYYFYWLKPVIDAGEMSRIWAFRRPPLPPTTMGDLLDIGIMARDVIHYLGSMYMFIFGTCVAGAFLNAFLFKNRFISIIYLGILIALIASGMGMFPIEARMFLFIFPLFAILFFFLLDRVCFKNNLIGNLVLITVSFFIIGLPNLVSFYFVDRPQVYRGSCETNFAIEHIEQNIGINEKVYIDTGSAPGFLYKNQFDSTSIAGFENNVILGYYLYGDVKREEDAQKIIDNAPCYLLVSHLHLSSGSRILMDILKEIGDVDMVYDEYDTYVYYYKNNENPTPLNPEL